MSVDSFLEYDHKFARVCIVVAVIMILVSIVLGSKDDIWYVGVFVGIVYGLVFIIIDVINTIKTKEVLKKYGFDTLKNEILQSDTILFEKKIYITENYVICHTNRPLVTPIDEIYKLEYSSYKGFNFVVATLKNQSKVSLAKVNDRVSAEKLMGYLTKRNTSITIA